MDEISVSTSRMKSDLEKIQSCIKNIISMEENLKSEVINLHNSWQGEANEAFNLSISEDFESIDRLIETADKMCEYMSNSIEEYVSCENNVGERIDSIAI